MVVQFHAFCTPQQQVSLAAHEPVPVPPAATPPPPPPSGLLGGPLFSPSLLGWGADDEPAWDAGPPLGLRGPPGDLSMTHPGAPEAAEYPPQQPPLEHPAALATPQGPRSLLTTAHAAAQGPPPQDESGTGGAWTPPGFAPGFDKGLGGICGFPSADAAMPPVFVPGGPLGAGASAAVPVPPPPVQLVAAPGAGLVRSSQGLGQGPAKGRLAGKEGTAGVSGSSQGLGQGLTQGRTVGGEDTPGVSGSSRGLGQGLAQDGEDTARQELVQQSRHNGEPLGERLPGCSQVMGQGLAPQDLVQRFRQDSERLGERLAGVLPPGQALPTPPDSPVQRLSGAPGVAQSRGARLAAAPQSNQVSPGPPVTPSTNATGMPPNAGRPAHLATQRRRPAVTQPESRLRRACVSSCAGACSLLPPSKGRKKDRRELQQTLYCAQQGHPYHAASPHRLQSGERRQVARQLRRQLCQQIRRAVRNGRGRLR